jgi:hypothetical protein
MPEIETLQRARRDKREGKAPSTQAGEFVREEIRHIREGRHGARSPQQAIAIGLSEARRAGVDLPPQKRGSTSEKSRKSESRAYALGHGAAPRRKTSAKRIRASTNALKRESRDAASPAALARHARSAAARRSPEARSMTAKKAARTKGPAVRAGAARKAAHSRAAHAR